MAGMQVFLFFFTIESEEDAALFYSSKWDYTLHKIKHAKSDMYWKENCTMDMFTVHEQVYWQCTQKMLFQIIFCEKGYMAWRNHNSTEKNVTLSPFVGVKEVRLSKSTAIHHNFVHEMCVEDLLSNPIIGGPEKHCDIDESVFSKRKYNRGRILPQQWVFRGVCHEIRSIFACSILSE